MIEALTSTTTTASAAQPLRHQKLVTAAQHFESIFLQEMMKPFALEKDDGDDGSRDDTPGGSNSYQSMGVESMAAAISRAGGLGIARSVVASVERQEHGRLEREKSATQS